MSRRLSGRISPSAQRGLPRPRVLSGADLTFFLGKILIPSTECAKLISRNQAESKRERERERENEGRKRTDAAASKRFDRAGRRSTRRHWRTEFNYTAGMTDTLMGGRGSSSNFGNTFLAFLFPRPLDRGLRSLTR